MIHTPHVRKILFTVAVLGPMLLAGQREEAGIPVLDWTGPPPPPKGTFGFPGDEGGGAPGLKPDPRYPLPLELTVRSVLPASIAPGRKLVIELLVRNIGSDPYWLPVARNDGTVHAAGNKGRRSCSVTVRFYAAGGGPPQEVSGETAWGSASAPASLFRLPPGQAVILRFDVTPEFTGTGTSSRPSQYNVTAACSEWTSRDDEYRIQGRSETIEAKNRLPITVLPLTR